MEGGRIFTNQVFRGLRHMGFCRLGKTRIARLLARPIQQRQVHVAVDDHPPGLFGIVKIASRLDNLRLFMETLQ